jgi:hypothetical protein
MKIILTENQLKRIIEQSSDVIPFKNFSEPIFIPQFKINLVKFLNTSKFEKDPESDRIIFRNESDGKEFIFDSDIIQKSGKSDFYINLDDLSRRYNVQFKDNFEYYKPNLSKEDEIKLINDSVNSYFGTRKFHKCSNTKCEEYTTTISKIIDELYSSYYIKYKPIGCDYVMGFVNLYPFKNTEDIDGNEWSKLNYLSMDRRVLQGFVKDYINQRKTFNHDDFILWLIENKNRFFKGTFMDSLIQIVTFSNPTIGIDLSANFESLLPDLEIINSFCPSKSNSKSKTFLAKKDGKVIKIQYIQVTKKIQDENSIYYKFSLNHGPILLDKNVDYIATNKGDLIPNKNIRIDTNSWTVSR